jgi:methanogenic corrinoid protein MtbC1
MVGGGAVDEKVREYTGADAYGADAVAAVNLSKTRSLFSSSSVSSA